MVLCIDTGNTRVKIAMVDGSGVHRLADVDTKRVVENPEIVSRLLQNAQRRAGDPRGAALSSVVPGANAALRKAVRSVFDISTLVIDGRSRSPIRPNVKNRQAVGADRLAAAAGLHPRTANAVIVDIGSAVTVDLVEGRVFKGGLIMAGPALSLRALGTFARRLPVIDHSGIARHFPAGFNDTRPSMVLGAHIGVLGAVKEAVRFLSNTSRAKPRVIVTGGGAAVFAERWPAGWRSDPDLVFRGIHRIWLLNRS